MLLYYYFVIFNAGEEEVRDNYLTIKQTREPGWHLNSELYAMVDGRHQKTRRRIVKIEKSTDSGSLVE